MYVKDLNESARAKLDTVLADGYTVDEYGLISSPGKFEAEPFATPILWQMGLEGFSDVDESDDYGNLYEFAMTPAELADYGLDYGFGTKPLNGTHFYVHLSESDQGFVSLNMTQQSLDEMNGDYDDSNDDPDNMDSWYESLGAQYAPEYECIYPLPFDENAYSAARAAYDAGKYDNNMTSAIELYEWKRDNPQHYAVYVSTGTLRDYRNGRATTWMGDMLGRVVLHRKSYSPVGGVFWAITVYGSNGTSYYGRWFYESGDVAVIHAHKNQSR